MAKTRRRKPGKKAHRLRRSLLKSLDLPEETSGAAPKCTLLGRSDLLVENHGGVLQYGPDCIRLYTSEGVLAISGEELLLSELGKERAYVEGRVQGITYEK